MTALLHALIGPTASGKESTALAVAAHAPVEILSLDSMKVYRGMSIGTAKASREARRRVPHHLVDIAAAKREVGDRVCIIGNIDPVGTLLLGTPEKVLEESRRCIADAGQRGGFVLAPGCGVPPNSPPENLEAMSDAVERYGGYPLVGTRAG